MNSITSVDWGLTPQNKPSYNIDWSLTQFCNLDCSYCTAHNNSTEHPPIDECIMGIEFAFQYANLIMSVRKKYERNVTLNLLGGEVLIHPDIVAILEYCHSLYQEKYATQWNLNVCLLTNAAIGKAALKRCLPYIKHWTVSYHTETNKKQKRLILDNIFKLHQEQKLSRVRVMMHSDPTKFNECLSLIELLKENSISYEVTPIGVHQTVQFDKTVHQYSKEQSQTILSYWNRNEQKVNEVPASDEKFVVTKTGYPCCSGQLLCVNQDRKNLSRHIPMVHFKDWYCSVNLSFLSINQITKKIHYNSACRVNNQSELGAVGTLNDTQSIIKELESQVLTNSVPVIQCPKDICGCGRCSPKASNLETFKKIMSVHITDNVLKFHKTKKEDANGQN